MPGLSKYWFNQQGECISVLTGQHKKMKNIIHGRMQYDVRQDNGLRTTITMGEIIAYGKHLKHQYNGGDVIMVMKLQSKHT